MMAKVKIWTDKHLKGDPVIWAVAIALSLLSILVVYSATGTLAFKRMVNPEHYLIKHTMLVVLGLLGMYWAHKLDYRFYSKISRFALWVSVPLLIFTFTNGVSLNDASRWIELPFFDSSFQPSDLASLALIASLAAMLARRQQSIEDFKQSFIPTLFWCGIICTLIGLTNLSSALLLFITCVLIMFLGRVPMKYLSMLLLVGVLAATLALMYGVRGETAKSRVTDFIDSKELPFQAKHARIAVASGGITGKGPGQSQQRNILPHPYSDFIYAIIIEEYGLIGGTVVVILYLILLARGMRIAYHSDKAFGGLLAAGLSFALVLQAMVNMGVVVGLGPITGLPLPMISMGGTSLLFTGLALGMIQSVARGEVDEIWTENSGSIKNIARAA
jgi:cell division protein FtsW